MLVIPIDTGDCLQALYSLPKTMCTYTQKHMAFKYENALTYVQSTADESTDNSGTHANMHTFTTYKADSRQGKLDSCWALLTIGLLQHVLACYRSHSVNHQQCPRAISIHRMSGWCLQISRCLLQYDINTVRSRVKGWNKTIWYLYQNTKLQQPFNLKQSFKWKTSCALKHLTQ